MSAKRAKKTNHDEFCQVLLVGPLAARHREPHRISGCPDQRMVGGNVQEIVDLCFGSRNGIYTPLLIDLQKSRSCSDAPTPKISFDDQHPSTQNPGTERGTYNVDGSAPLPPFHPLPHERIWPTYASKTGLTAKSGRHHLPCHHYKFRSMRLLAPLRWHTSPVDLDSALTQASDMA